MGRGYTAILLVHDRLITSVCHTYGAITHLRWSRGSSSALEGLLILSISLGLRNPD